MRRHPKLQKRVTFAIPNAKDYFIKGKFPESKSESSNSYSESATHSESETSEKIDTSSTISSEIMEENDEEEECKEFSIDSCDST